MNYIFTCLLFCLLSCSATTEKGKTPTVTPINLLSLGDSYTIGTSVETSSNFPNQLKDSLTNYGYKIDQLNIIAKNGWTTKNLIDGIDDEKPTQNYYDLVTLLIGVNNQYQSKDFSVYKTELKVLIETAIAHSKKGKDGVIILSIPDYSVTPFVNTNNKEIVSQEIAKYNQFKEYLADSVGIEFINITPISVQAAEDLSLIAPDQLHPSAKMYSLWVAEMLDKSLLSLSK
jgi:lysophospholipase L1-like esterase